MTDVRVGVFTLVDPPPGQEAIIRAAIEAIDYPWERLDQAVADDPDGTVLVTWTDTGQGTSGLFYGYSNEIRLGTRAYHLGAGAAFVFAHEVGHMVDDMTLRDEDRAALTQLLHATPGRHDGQQMNGAEHPWSHRQPHAEDWVSANDYLFRLNEAYADQFVAGFAPSIWDGTVLPDAGAHYPRFVHWSDDHAAVRRLTLARDMTSEPRPRPTPPAAEPEPEGRMVKRRQGRYVRRALRLGLMKRQGGRFRPRARVTRAQVARALVRLYDKLTKEKP